MSKHYTVTLRVIALHLVTATLCIISFVSDLPLIVSGKYMAFIDPHRTTVERKETQPAGVKKRLTEVFKYSGHVSTFHGIFDCDKTKSEYNATLFRFPLRQCHSRSMISRNVDSVKDVRESHFESLKSEASFLLLFLNNVKKISLYDMNDTDRCPRLLFSVNADNHCRKSLKEACHNILQKELGNPLTSFVNLNCTTVFTTDFAADVGEEEYHWLTLNVIGTSDDEVVDLGKELSTFPWVGLAAQIPKPVKLYDASYKCSSDQLVQCKGSLLLNHIGSPALLPIEGNCVYTSGQAFCFLPLPIYTALPVHVHGYFAVNDNRRGIKWPGHDENSAEARWNRALICKLVAPAYSLLLSSISQLFSYESSLSCIRHQSRGMANAAYSSWPLISDLKNNHMWRELLQPMLSTIEESRVLWSPVRGGEWVKVAEAYFIPVGGCPSVVIQTLLKAGLPVVVLPDSIHETLSSVDHLHQIMRSRIVTPKLMRMNFPPDTKFSFSEVCTLLEYVLSDLNRSNVSEIFDIALLPLQDKSCCKFSSSSAKYLFTGSWKCYIFPGADDLIIDTDLPDSVMKLFEKIASEGLTQIKVPNLQDVQVLFKASLSTWLSLDQSETQASWSWFHGKENHPSLSWLKGVWKWIMEESVPFESLVGLPLVPLVYPDDSEITLVKVSMEAWFCRLEGDMNRSEWHSLFKKLRMSVVADAITGSISHFPCLDQEMVLEKLGRNVDNPSTIGSLSVRERELLRTFLSKCGYTKKGHINCLRKLAIFSEVPASASSFVSLDEPKRPFLTELSWPQRLVIPRGMLCNEDQQVVKLIKSLGTLPIAFSEFCKQHLIPLVKDLISSHDSCCRGDEIVLWMFGEMLGNSREEASVVLKLLSDKPIVKTKAGKYSAAKELYGEDKEFRILFDDVADKTPDDKYSPYSHLLKEMGLVHWSPISSNRMQLKAILSRSIANITSNKKLKRRGRFILNQIFGANSILSQADKEAFSGSQFKFLSPLEQPPSYPSCLKWFTASPPDQLYCIESLFPYTPESPFLVGAIGPIISHEYASDTEIGEAIKLCAKPITKADVNIQLDYIETVKFQPKDGEAVSQVVQQIYKYLSRENTKRSHIWCPSFTPPLFMEAAKFVITPPRFDLKPYFYELTYKDFSSLWNIKLKIVADDAVDILLALKKDCDRYGRCLTNRELEMSGNLVVWVYKQKEHPRHSILLPTAESQLEAPQDCVYDDREWASNTTFTTAVKGKSLKYVSPEFITAAIAKHFNVRPLSLVVAPSSNLAIEYTKTGQHEAITNRIARIVEDYNDDIDIFKELIQNADDAEATEISFLIDWRKHPDSSLFCSEMKAWQGPALLVYNNATFSNQDLENICKVAGETKLKDPMKTGRFGLGFCATYQMTDLPSFVSGKYLVIFDPHTSFLGERINSSQPGMKIDLVDTQRDLDCYSDQFVPYNGVFNCDIFHLPECGYDGTLFRFPFRDLKTSKCSCISGKVYDEREVKSLIGSLTLNSHELVLFQKHLNQISLYEFKPKSSNMTKIFSVSRKCANLSSRMKLLSTLCPATAPIQHSNACVFTSSQGQESSESAWIVCSSAGTGAISTELLEESRARGVLPFGEIALKISGSGISKCREKVKKGRVFCFLPLPIYSGLEFHVNGHFHVSKDRRSLTLSDDGSFGTQWNTFLSRQVHSQAFLSVLTHFIADVDLKLYSADERNKFLESYYQLWNFASTSTSIASKIVKGIKASIIAAGSEYKLLWSEVKGGMWISIEEAILLVTSASREVISDGLAMLLELEYKVVKVPHHVLPLVQGKVASLGHMYDYKRFVTEVLFPQIDHFVTIWQNSLLYLLEQLSAHTFRGFHDFGWAMELLLSKPCIPCQHCSEFVKINDLIDCTQEKLAPVYDVSEGKFPIQILLQSPSAKLSLIELGMSSHKLKVHQLVDRAQSVERLSLQCLESARERSLKLVDYISSRYNERSDLSELNSISSIPFLIVSRKPDCVQLPWFGESVHFCSPCEAFGEGKRALVFTVANLTSVTSPLPLQKNPSCQLVIQHLSNLAKHVCQTKLNDTTVKYMNETMIKVYKYLNQELYYRKIKADFPEVKALRSIACPIWQDGAFLPASSVIKGCQVTCHPYITRLSERYSEYDALFLHVLGVNIELGAGKIAGILENLYEDFLPDSPLSRELLQFAVQLSSTLASMDVNIGGLFLPDENRVMRPACQLACDNLKHDWIKDLPTYQEHFQGGSGFFVHPDIPREKAIKLGVKPLLDAIIQEIEDDSFLDGIDYGQHEDLCVRLNSILSKYPADASILQEFIQNADDAQASEIVFILDHRVDYPDKTLLCDTAAWRALQHTPALCIVNNRKFTKRDIEGISDLGRGAKGDSSEKIGKFGIGFNVAYHITDCPSFLSCGEGGVPENLCVFDPALCYVHKKGKKKPGRRWELSSRHTADFRDQFEPYLLGDLQNFGSGVLSDINETGHTVFRLPLTRRNRGSKINGEKFTTSDIEELFKVFMQSSKEVLLFLNNIKSISAIEIKKDGQCIHRFTTSSVIPSEYTDDCMKFLKASIECTTKLRSGVKPEPLSLFHKLDILQCTEAHEEKQSWLVQKAVCGTFKRQELQLALKQHNLRAVGGVAAPLHASKREQHRLFCYLPTPVETNLPVHVNGHFIVDDSRKHLESKQIFGRDCSDWNFLLTERVIVPAYIQLITNAKDYYCLHEQNDSFKYLCQIFPRTAEVNIESPYISIQTDNSKLEDFTTSTFYKQFSAKGKLPLLYTEGESGRWISFEEAIFYLESYTEGNRIISVPHEIMKVAIELGLNIVDCLHIYKGFTSVGGLKLGPFFGRSLSILNQQIFINFLSSMDENVDIIGIVKNNLHCLLNFCIQEKKKKQIVSVMKALPILCADGSLKRGGNIYCFKYSRLLPRCLPSIVDKGFESSDIGSRLRSCGVITDPSLEYVALHIDIKASIKPCVLTAAQIKLLTLLWATFSYSGRKTEVFVNAFKDKPILPTAGNTAFPMRLSKSVIGNPEKSTREVLKKLGYDELDFKVISPKDGYDNFFIDGMTFSKNADFLPCFKLGEPPNCDAELSDDEVKLVLTAFSEDDVSEVSRVLLKLKLYKHADNKRYVSVQSEHSVCIVPSALPKDGLDILQNQSPTVIFLKEPGLNIEGLYETIIPGYSDSILDSAEVYVEHIVPNLSHMNDSQILSHIDYIQKDTNLRNSTTITDILKEVRFVKCKENLKRPDELFDPRKRFFEVFRSEDLPCMRWRTDGRLGFLCDLGLCKVVSTAEWILQARASVSKCRLFIKPSELSDILCKELSSIISVSNNMDPTLKDFLLEVSEIPFIHTANSIYESSLFEKAFKLQLSSCEMVKFSRSISHHNGPLAFNMRTILPEKCDQIISNPTIRTLLNVENPIKVETVLGHLKYLCDAVDSQTASSQTNSLSSTDGLLRVFDRHYKFLNSIKLLPVSITFLKNFACLVIGIDGVKLKTLKLTQVVEQLPSSFDLEPFCYRLPPKIAQHTNLTKALNIRKELKAEDYGEILACINKVDDAKSSQAIAKCAYNGLITCLRKHMCSSEILSDGYSGYVLSEYLEILHTKDSIYNNVPWHAERLPQGLYKYILSPQHDQQGSRNPPKLMKVRYLSDVVRERIHDDCKSKEALCAADVLHSQNKREERCVFSGKIAATLKSRQFVEGMLRVYYADHGCCPPEDFQKSVQFFEKLEVVCLETPLKTVLCGEDDTIIPRSETCTKFSTLLRDEGILFISPHGKDIDIQTLVGHVSSELNLALSEVIKNEKNISALFEYEPESIHYGLTMFHQIPEFSLDKYTHTIHSSGDSNNIGDSLSLSTLTIEDSTIIVNFKCGELVRYYASSGELLLAKVMESHDNSDGVRVTTRCIEITTEDTPKDELDVGMHSFLVSPLEIFKILTAPQIKSLRSNKSSPFASPLVMTDIPCGTVAEMKQWFRDFYFSDDLLMYSGLLMSLIKIRLTAHFHHQLIVKDISLAMFRLAILEVLHYAANEELPYTSISIQSNLADELSSLTCAMEALSLSAGAADTGTESSDEKEESLGTHAKPQCLSNEAASVVTRGERMRSTEQPGCYQATRRVGQQKPKSVDRYQIRTQAVQKPVKSSSHPSSASSSKKSSHTSSHSTSKAPPAGKAYSRFTSPSSSKPQRRSRLDPAPPKVVKKPPFCEEKARAWLEQAKVDYRAAQDILRVPASVNKSEDCQFPALVCFLCHDVVEKCLKGLLYIFVEDIIKCPMNCSNLVTLMNQLRGDKVRTLHEMCNDAVMVVSVYESKSRYPHFHNPPCAPAAIYLQKDAVEAFSAVSTLMEKLKAVQAVHNVLGDLNIVPKPRFISAMKSTTAEGKYILHICVSHLCSFHIIIILQFACSIA